MIIDSKFAVTTHEKLKGVLTVEFMVVPNSAAVIIFLY